MINFEYFKVFYFVARNKNITHAAEAMYMSQPAVTKIIRSLESQIHCELMIRSKRGIELTPDGLRFFNVIAPACESLISVEQSIENGRLLSGAINISMNPAVSDLVTQTLLSFRKAYPDIDIQIDSDVPEMKKRYLKDRTRDIIIDYEGILDNEESSVNGWVKTVIGINQTKAYVGQSMSKLFGDEVTLQDLITYPLILPNHDEHIVQLYKKLYGENDEKIQTIQISSSLRLQKTLAMMNEGILFTSEIGSDEDLEAQGLVCLNVTDPLPKKRIIMYSPEEKMMSETTRVFYGMILLSTSHSF